MATKKPSQTRARTSSFQTEVRAGFAKLDRSVNLIANQVAKTAIDVSTLQTDVAGLKKDVGGLRADVTGLQNGQRSLEQSYGSLREGQDSLRASMIGIESNIGQILAVLREGHAPQLKKHDDVLGDHETRISVLEDNRS